MAGRPNSNPETIMPTISDENWRAAAAKLGWTWSHAHGGLINERHRAQGLGWDTYKVAADAEEACDWDGIETEEQALAKAKED
jgi:hypothetical protein